MKVAIVKDHLGHTNTEFASTGVDSFLYEATLGEAAKLGEGFYHMGTFEVSQDVHGESGEVEIYAVKGYDDIYIESPTYLEYGALYTRIYKDVFLKEGITVRLGYMENEVLAMNQKDIKEAIDKAAMEVKLK